MYSSSTSMKIIGSIVAFLFFATSIFAQSNNLQGEILYKVYTPPVRKTAAPPPPRLFKVSFNGRYVREEWVDEPEKFAITDVLKQTIQYSKDYYGMDMVIEADVKPRDFNIVESPKEKTIANKRANLAIVFVNEDWTDVFYTKEIAISYPSLYGVPGMALEYSIPGEKGDDLYSAYEINYKTLDPSIFDINYSPALSRASDNEEIRILSAELAKEQSARKAAEREVIATKEALAEAKVKLRKAEEEKVKAQDEAKEAKRDKALILARLENARTEEQKAKKELEKAKFDAIEAQVELKTIVAQLEQLKKNQEQGIVTISPEQVGKEQDIVIANQAEEDLSTEPVKTQKKLGTLNENGEVDLKDLADNTESSKVDKERQEQLRQKQIAIEKARAKAEADRKAKEIALKKAKEELAIAERAEKERLEKERLEFEAAEKAKLEMEAAERAKFEAEQARIAEQKAKEAAQLKAKEEAIALEKTKVEAQRKAKAEAAKIAAENQAKEEAMAAKVEAVRKAKEEAELAALEAKRTAEIDEAKDDGFMSLKDFASNSKPTTPSKKPTSGAIIDAPDFNTTLLNNQSTSLDQYEGKVIVLNFWFVACRPCVSEIPKLNKLVENYKGKDVVFLAMGLDNQDRIQSFVNKYQFDYDIVPLAKTIASDYGVRTYPTHIVIDKSGKIISTQNGFTDLVEKEIIRAIDGALAKP